MAVKTVSTLTALLSGIISEPGTTDVTNKYVKYSEACFIPILQAANTVYTSPISSIGFYESAGDYYPGEVPTLTSSSSLTKPYIRFANVSKSLQSSGIFYASGGASTYSYYCSTNTSGIIWYPHYANDTSTYNGLGGYRAVTIGFWFSPGASALSATTAQIFSVVGSTLTSSSTSNGRFVLAFRSGVLSYLAQSCNTGGSESTASYTAISSASTLSAGTWYYCLATIKLYNTRIINGTSNYQYIICTQILNQAGTQQAFNASYVTFSSMSQLRYVFGSLGALYSSYGATSYCQFHSLFLAYGATCITASPTVFTAVAKELIAIRDYYFDFNSFKSGGISFTHTSFVGWPAAASQAAHGLAIYYLAAGNYTIGLTRSSTSETTYDPINVYAVSAPGADQDWTGADMMLCSTNMWSFTSGTTVQYKRPLDINERWSLVGQTNNSSYYTTNIALSEPTFIIISAVRDGSGGPTYFDCTITITKDEDNSYAHVLSQNALNIDGGINLKVAYYNNSGTKTVLDQIKYSSHIVWGRNYPCKIYGVNYAVGLSTALGGPYGSTTSEPTDLYTVSYTNSTAVPLNPLQSAYFGVKRVRWVGEDSQNGATDTYNLLCTPAKFETYQLTFDSTTYYTGSLYGYIANGSYRDSGIGVTCTGKQCLFNDTLTFTPSYAYSSTAAWRPFMYENYTSSFAATSPLMLADFPSKLGSKSCILTAAKTVTLSGKALNSNNCEEFVVGYAPVSYFVNYGAVSISNLSVKLLLKNYQSESITVKTVTGTYQYVTYIGTLISDPITKSITSGNSVTLSDYGGSSYLTLGTLTDSKAMLSSDCKICLLLSVAVGSGSVSYIYLTNSNSSTWNTMNIYGTNN